jgi:hypothetical protein
MSASPSRPRISQARRNQNAAGTKQSYFKLVSSLLGLFFDLQDGGDIFLRKFA